MARPLPSLAGRLLRLVLPVIVALSGLTGARVYNALYDVILSRFEVNLATISGLVGAFIDPVDHAFLAGAIGGPGFSGPEMEKTAQYARAIAPMRRVRRELGLTYLYTQVPSGPSTVVYVLDGTEGDQHTTVGYEDELPDDTMNGLRAVGDQGQIYSSPVQKQENWGLLKTSAAPIWTPQGHFAGSVGADVNIGIIRDSTENALLICSLIGGLAMLVAVASISVVTRQIARPLAHCKLTALSLAAGRLSIAPAPRSLRELNVISDQLCALAARLRCEADSRLSAEAALHRMRQDADLALALGARAGVVAFVESGALLICGFPPAFSDTLASRVWLRVFHGVADIAERQGTYPIPLLRALGGRFLIIDRHFGTMCGVGGVPMIGPYKPAAAEPVTKVRHDAA